MEIENKTETNTTLGARIRGLRQEHGYSQEYLAEQLDVSRQAVSKWEQDLSAPDTNNLIALSSVLGVSVEYLALGKKQETPPPEIRIEKHTFRRRDITGYILLACGILSVILGVLFNLLLVVIGVVLAFAGILCLTLRQGAGLYVFWGILILCGIPLVIGYSNVATQQVISVDENIAAYRSEPALMWGGIFTVVWMLLVLLAVVLTVIKIVKKRKEKL